MGSYLSSVIELEKLCMVAYIITSLRGGLFNLCRSDRLYKLLRVSDMDAEISFFVSD